MLNKEPGMPEFTKEREVFLDAVDVAIADGNDVSGPDQDMLRTYIGSFVRRGNESTLEGLNAEAAVDAARAFLAFVSKRAGDEIQVRVFNPTKKAHGYTSEYTILETCMPDQPFLLDTLRLLLRTEGIREHRCHHPILDVTRDDDGNLTSLRSGSPSVRESWMHFELERITDKGRLKALEDQARANLTMSQGVVRDHRRMLRRVTAATNSLLLVGGEQTGRQSEIDNNASFLTWLLRDNFIFLGFEELKLQKGDDGQLNFAPTSIKLGIRREDFLPADQWPQMPSAAEAWRETKDLLILAKDDVDSRVHRGGKLDTVLLQQLDESGTPIAMQLITGLFTYKAISQEGATIPVLRTKLREILAHEDAEDGSHHYKGIIAAFNSLPVEYLFYSDVEGLRQAVRLVNSAEVKKQAQVFLRIGPNRRSAFLLLSMPREGWNETLRQAISDKLTSSLGATYQDDRQTFGEHSNVVATYFVTADRPFDAVDLQDVERELLILTQTWDEKFANVLLERVKASAFDGLHRRYLENLPQRYKLMNSPSEAVEDILALERLRTTSALQFRVTSDSEQGTCRLKIYEQENIFLTDSLPVLANFGLRVIKQESSTIPMPDSGTYVMDTFRVNALDQNVDLLRRADDLAEALRAVLTDHMENDLLNQLVIEAGLSFREVDMLRAYISCARQIESHFPLEYTRRVWSHHTSAARLLVDLIKVKFDPDSGGGSETARADAVANDRERFLRYLQEVENAAEDRVLRTVFNLVDATVRTNYFRLPTRPYISFKLDSHQVEFMPSPRPHREIFVHHAHVEGVHLRGGPIARGGIRWSDRFDDYRTEILGLMRTQMVKNTVIVPVGSKGGFVLKKAYSSREEERAQADALYKVFMSGLLDITDNLVDGKVVPPDRVVRYDEDDPYLVVAADKGTAHLSDTANALSEQYGFWLGDAFASGGSVGYDHKKEGITARGAWECTRRHFQEMGINPEKDIITVSGIGDMSGDVFGNGLLLSKTIKLQAAFNHMHIFFDPDPDPAASWQERKRLFELPRSTWEDYDATKISQGGGIYSRSAKAIPLSPEVKALLGTEADTMTGDEVVKAILLMEVDLLWNGGIGTYVKATWETDLEVGDRINDPVRINATELKAKVIGEGGNLGLTRASRIEYGRLGGRLNTDFVDNSAGVDMSDHEVNLKLLFNRLVSTGEMDYDGRNALLKKLTDEVSVAVLANNKSQSRAISLDVIRSQRNLTPFSSLIEDLDREGVAKREAENLPPQDLLNEMLSKSEALSRPELATLLAFTKMRIYSWLLAEERFSGGVVERATYSYFPKEVRDRFPDTINAHALRKEITATVLTTRIVDNAGTTFFQEVWEDTSFSVPEIAMAYLIAAEMLGASRLEERLASLEGVTASDTLYQAWIAIEDALDNLTRRMLRRGFNVFEPDQVVDRYATDFRELNFTLVDVLPAVALQTVISDRDTYIQAGLPEALAQELATFPHLVSAGDIAILAEEGGLDLPTSAWLYHAVGEEVRARSAMRLAEVSGPVDRWEKSALHVIRGKIIDAQYKISLNIARSHQGDGPIKGAFEAYFADRKALAQRAKAIEGRIRTSKGDGLAPATVLAEVIEELAAE